MFLDTNSWNSPPTALASSSIINSQAFISCIQQPGGTVDLDT